MTTTDKDFVVKNGLVVQGAQGTIDGSVIVTEAALNTSLGDYVAIIEKGAADGVAELDASANVKTVSAVVFEGATLNTHQVSLQIALDPTVDRTITIPDVTGTIVTTGNINDAYPSQTGQTGKYLKTDGTNVSWETVSGGSLSTLTIGTGLSGTSYNGSAPVTIAIDSTVATTSGTQTLTNKTLTSPLIDGSGIIFEGTTANDFETILAVVDPTEDRTITLPNISGTVITTGDSGTVTSTMIADGTIVNNDINASAAIAVSKLAASTISGVTLGNNLNTLTIGTGLSGTSYNGSSAVTVAIDSSVATTSGLQTLTNKTLGASTVLGADLSAGTFKITSLGTPTASTDAVTKQYVDDIAQGLHIHASCVTATTTNINLSTDLEAGDSIDGVTLVAGNRVLVKNQSTTSQNGIYLAVTSGAAVRASDFDSSAEIQGGDFVFVTGGTVNDNTGWVQINQVTTVGTDPIQFVQFSGAGTYLAGNGLLLTGNTFSIDRDITADLNTAQIFVNKTISGTSNTITNVSLTSGVTGTLPVANGGTGITSFGTGIATFLGTPSSANLAAAITDETGSGSLVFATSPTLTTPNIGVATGTSFNNITALSSSNPLANGTAAVGTSTAVAREDHVHPISALTIGTGLSGTSYNGSSAVTIAIDSTVTTLTGTQTLTNKTLTSPIITLATSTPSFTTNAYTLVLGDQYEILLASNGGTAGTINIPTNATAAFPIGTQITIIQTGSGQLTIQAATPATTTVNSTGATATAPKLRVQNSSATLIKTNTDTWYVVGDIS